MDTTSLCKHPLLLQSGAKLNSVTQLGVDKKLCIIIYTVFVSALASFLVKMAGVSFYLATACVLSVLVATGAQLVNTCLDMVASGERCCTLSAFV